MSCVGLHILVVFVSVVRASCVLTGEQYCVVSGLHASVNGQQVSRLVRCLTSPHVSTCSNHPSFGGNCWNLSACLVVILAGVIAGIWWTELGLLRFCSMEHSVCCEWVTVLCHGVWLSFLLLKSEMFLHEFKAFNTMHCFWVYLLICWSTLYC